MMCRVPPLSAQLYPHCQLLSLREVTSCRVTCFFLSAIPLISSFQITIVFSFPFHLVLEKSLSFHFRGIWGCEGGDLLCLSRVPVWPVGQCREV